ncbi:hypothetical protein OCH239_16005 [Roseivivax halodurans JCM 10272]|uniref:Uncharacterized protein n=1 Tax=Roseivivax halodurans JCM 10272 TaxID=1449350 RepID=X7EI05_9RHOB|nr:hypothetical protein [Roseivivax halodurans]ETX15495.1 hypothetical protein OCH239_16005 [Roseivivax halodurans JCM 10272]
MPAGPSRGEHLFRLIFSLCGLVLLVAAIVIRGWPRGAAIFEVIGIAGLFLGGSAAWSAWKLWSNR